MKVKSLLGCILAAFLALLVANFLVPGFKAQGELTQALKILMLAGIMLGLINFFIKPIIDLITIPLKWLSFGLFSLIVNMGMVWLLDILFPETELSIEGIRALFWTSLLVWLFNLFVPKKDD